MTNLEYLKERYLAKDEPEWYLNVRVPFDYKSEKFMNMNLVDFIDFINEIEEAEENEIYEIIKTRL